AAPEARCRARSPPTTAPRRPRRRWPPAPRDRGPGPWRSARRAPRERAQRHVPVLALRQLLTLRAQHLEPGDELEPGLLGLDDVIDISALGRDVGVRVALDVLVDQLGPAGFGVGGLLELA